MSAILAYLARHHDAMLRDIETLVRAASPSTRKALVDRCGRVLAELVAARLGVRGERIPQAEVGDHYRFAIGDGDRQVLLLAHHDTVWEEGRLAFRVEGSRAYGPGIFDMKGGPRSGGVGPEGPRRPRRAPRQARRPPVHFR